MASRHELPTTWAWVPLADLGRWCGGGTPSKENPAFWVEAGVPWVSAKDMKSFEIRDTEDHITAEAIASSATTVVPAGTVLTVTRSGILRHTFPVAVTRTESAINQDLKALLPAPGIQPEFVAYALRAFGQEILHDCAKDGTTVQSVEFEKLRRFEIPLAPTVEQERLVNELEARLSDTDAAVAALKRVQANLKRYRASVLKAACEGRLVPTEAELARTERRPYETGEQLLKRILVERRAKWEADQLAKMLAAGKPPKNDGWKKKYKEPDAPDTGNMPSLPEGWTWAGIAQLAFIGTGATPKRGTRRYYESGTIAWVTSGAVNEEFVNEATELVTEAALAETNLTVFAPGTLLLAMYGEGKTRGKVTELRISATTNQAIAGIALVDSVRRRFVKTVLRASYEAMRLGASGGVQPNLNLDIVRRVPIPLPPDSEQLRIEQEVEKRLSSLESVESSTEKQFARADRLRQSILKRAFEGKLVPQDPNDEPASVLLERIRAERESSSKQKAKPRSRRARTVEAAGAVR